LTLGYGLNDSPAGLAAWIVDKFWAWSDHGGKLDNSFTRDELITNVMIYWVTDTMPSSTRIYYESQHNLPRPKSMTPFPVSSKPAPMALCSLSQGDQCPAAGVGRAQHRRQAVTLDGDASRRPLRGARATPVAGGRRPCLLPKGPLA
jgi:hypothetical protein